MGMHWPGVTTWVCTGSDGYALARGDHMGKHWPGGYHMGMQWPGGDHMGMH